MRRTRPFFVTRSVPPWLYDRAGHDAKLREDVGALPSLPALDVRVGIKLKHLLEAELGAAGYAARNDSAIAVRALGNARRREAPVPTLIRATDCRLENHRYTASAKNTRIHVEELW
jgi:hypothetical protein